MAPAFVWVWWLPLILVAAEKQQREGCSSSAKTCGNLTISDPFLLANMETGRPCGSSDFEDTCSRNTPILRSSIPSGLGFEVINISYKERSLRVADGGKLNLARLQHLPTSDVEHLCLNAAATAAERQEKELVQTSIRCGKDNKVLVRTGRRYDETSNYGSYAIEGCVAACHAGAGHIVRRGLRTGLGYSTVLFSPRGFESRSDPWYLQGPRILACIHPQSLTPLRLGLTVHLASPCARRV
ncbi:hypothetical protein CFC21_039418 [Triticum aestivum]|uniref:Wall-associated receptor kinase galacturonan-binding domain-containing protein n=2 Tax=Triticum aestivum TaxID=4565 RepID=A0A9R1FE52_WHEAT|nr:hypothetical protein CFC21_039418 [Triticum aestivum]CDM80873.1 unnamed protein product [Triticum aestivum]